MVKVDIYHIFYYKIRAVN